MNKLNLKGVTPAVWARTIGFILVGINSVAISLFDIQLLPFGDEQIYESISTIVTFVAGIYTTWKDNPLTVAAQKGHEVTKELKEGAK